MSTTYVSVHIEDTTQIVAAATASRVELKVRRPDAHQIWMTGSAETMTRLRDALLSVLPLFAEVAS